MAVDRKKALAALRQIKSELEDLLTLFQDADWEPRLTLTAAERTIENDLVIATGRTVHATTLMEEIANQ